MTDDWNDGTLQLPDDGEPELAATADLVEPWDEPDPHLEVQRTRNRVIIRAIVFVVLSAVAVLSVLGSRQEFAYHAQGDDALVELGDVRERYSGGQTRLDVASNSYVEMKNLVMTYEGESDNYRYFYDPLYSVIVRTAAELPEKEVYRHVDIPASLVWLVENRQAFAEDLTVGFDARGRLLRADLAPRKLRRIAEQYNDIIRRPLDEIYILLDGETPGGYAWFAVAYGIAALLVLLTALFLARAIRNYRRVLRSL